MALTEKGQTLKIQRRPFITENREELLKNRSTEGPRAAPKFNMNQVAALRATGTTPIAVPWRVFTARWRIAARLPITARWNNRSLQFLVDLLQWELQGVSGFTAYSLQLSTAYS